MEDFETVMVQADRGKIGQMITNLLSNAAKYSPNGSSITITCKPSKDNVEIGIANN